MGHRSSSSAQTLAVLAELCATPSRWRHGYGLARVTGLKSGTLYPVLVRLADRGLVEACREDEQTAGRPRRHLYRITPEGLAVATTALAQARSADQGDAGPPDMRSGPSRDRGDAMEWLTKAIVTLLRYSEPVVPAEHRAWARALRTEASELPAGWDRLAWLAGGVRFTARQAALNREVAYPLAFAAAAAGTAWSVWSGPPGDSAIVINRVDVITVSALLVGLPLAVRRARGPIAGSQQARIIRTAGYAAILVLVKAAVERVADAPPNNLEASAVAWTGEIIFLAVIVGYAAVILASTADRSPVAPATVAIGTAVGAAVGVLVFVLGPLGCPLRLTGWWPVHLYDAALALGALLALCAPNAPGRAATRRAAGSMPAGHRVQQAAMAGLCTGTVAALTVAALSTATIALLPHDTTLRNWAEGHVGHWTPIVGQVTPVVGIRLGYAAGASAFAAGYLIVLLLSPTAGCALGAWAGRPGGRPDPARSGGQGTVRPPSTPGPEHHRRSATG